MTLHHDHGTQECVCSCNACMSPDGQCICQDCPCNPRSLRHEEKQS